MLTSLISILKSVLFFLVILCATLVTAFVLPFPLSLVHVGVLTVVLFLMKVEKNTIVWYMACYYVCLELLVPNHIFGSQLFAGTMSTLVVYWIHRFFLTNRSVYTGLLLGVLALLLYRCLWLGYIAVAVLFGISQSGIPSLFHIVLFSELLVTEVVLGIGLVVLRIQSSSV